MSEKDTLILAIESSCDETAASVARDHTEILSNVVSSQVEEHKLYGGLKGEIKMAYITMVLSMYQAFILTIIAMNLRSKR